VTAVVKAWDDNSVNVKSVTDDILQCLFHPDFPNHASQIQREMLACVRNWLQSLGHQQSAVLARLSKEAVRNHQNVRLGGEGASVTQSHGAPASNAGFPGQGNVSNLLHGVPGMSQAQGLYNQFSGGAGAGREGFGTTMGTVPAYEAAPPAVPISPRPGGGQAAGFFGDSPAPFASQSYMSPPAYPGGRPAMGSPPRSQPPSPRPARASSPYHGHGHGYPSPTQPGFPGRLDQPPYLPTASGFPDSGSQPPYMGGPPPVPPQGPSYPGSSYPGQTLYPGQQAGYLGMPTSGDSFSPPYGSPPHPPPSFPGTAPGFPQSGPGFPNAPNAQSGSGYGSAGYGGYGQGQY